MRIAIALLAVTTLALSGCVAPTTGLSLREAATSEAMSYDPDAVLVGVMGAEYADPELGDAVAEESPDAKAMAELGADPNPGDGLANAWAYFFRSEHADIIVVMGSDGTVLDSEQLPPGSSGANSFDFADPLPNDVPIDSNEAATIIVDQHDRFDELIQADDVVVMMFLLSDQEGYLSGIHWVFMAFTESQEDLAFALVNADDGTYTDFSDFFGE